jgi:hypothetical protein
MTNHRLPTEQAMKEITAALDNLAATITAALDDLATGHTTTPTLAEELRGIREWVDWEACAGFDEIMARAEQVEKERDEACAEVERLTAENEDLRRNRPNGHDPFLILPCTHTVQKAAERNAETPNPADVKPGEAWIVEVEGERRTALKDDDGLAPWNHVDSNGLLSLSGNERVTLITRLVPAPRVITNHDELDALPDDTIVRIDEGGDAMRKYKGKWHPTSNECCYESRHIALPVTVLWEPGA